MRVFSLLSFTLLSALCSAAFANEPLDRSEGLHLRSNTHGRRNAQGAQAQGQAIDTNTTTSDDDDSNAIALPSAASTGPTAPLGTGSANPSGMPNAASKNVNSGHRLPHFTYDQLYNLQIKFLDSFIYPNNQKEAQKINSTIFSEDVQGRVDVTRTFDGRELNTEYIYGLFSNLAASKNPDAFSLLGYATSYEVVHFAASQNIASASTRFNFTFPFLQLSVPVIIDTWNVFNAQGQVTMYDAVFKYFDWLFSYLLSTAASALHITEAELNCCVGWCIRTWCPIGRAYIARTLGRQGVDTVTIVRITTGPWRRTTSRTCHSCTRVGIVALGCQLGWTRVEDVPGCELGRVPLSWRGICTNFSEGVEDTSTIMRHGYCNTG